MRLALFSLLMIPLTFGCSTPDEAKPTTEPLPDMDGSVDTNDADGDGGERLGGLPVEIIVPGTDGT